MKVIGIDIEGNFAHFAVLNGQRKSVAIESLFSVEIPETTPLDVKQLYIAKALLKYNRKKSFIVTGLDSADILIRSLSLNIIKKRALKKALPFQLESLIHLDPSTTITLPIISQKNDKQTDLNVFTTTKESIRKHLESCNEMHIDPDYVSCKPLALVRFGKSITKDYSTTFILHIGIDKCTCVYMEKNMPKAAHTINLGVNDLYEALHKDKNLIPKESLSKFAEKIDLLHLNPQTYPNLFNLAKKLQKKISKVFFSFQYDEEQPNYPLLITGQIKSFIHISSFLQTDFDELIHHKIPDSEKEKEIPELKKYAISIGLALDVLAPDAHSLQFLQEEFIPSSHLKRLAFKATALLFISLIGSIGLLMMGNHLLHQRKSNLQKKLERISTFDHILLEQKGPNPILKQEGLEAQLSSWETKIQKESKDFVYHMYAPKVIDVLFWLDSHFIHQEGTLEIQDFRYELIQFPKLRAPRDPYLVKVHIEFYADSPMIARKFHQSLLQGDEIVNPTKEITWDVLSNTYRTTFYLKSKQAIPLYDNN